VISWKHFWHNDENWSSHKCIFVFHNRSAETSDCDKWYSLQKFFDSMYYVFLCYQSVNPCVMISSYSHRCILYLCSPQDGTGIHKILVYCEWLVLYEVGSKVVWKSPVNLRHLLHTLYWSYQVLRAVPSDIKILGCKIPVHSWLIVQPAVSSWRQLDNSSTPWHMLMTYKIGLVLYT
jgi:hypothetical protein